jgi:ankyrin repeat protein
MSKPGEEEGNFYANNTAGPTIANEEVFNTDDSREEQKMPEAENEDALYATFLNAIGAGNLPTVRELLEKHEDFVNRVDPQTRQTPIFFVSQIPNEDLGLEIARYLVEKGADINFKDTLKQNIAYYIARDGKTRFLDYALSLGLKATDADIYSQTPLYYASREGRLEMAAKLIDLGIDVNHVDQYTQTCLFYAAKNGNLEMCKLLVEKGAKHDHMDPKKQTPLAYAKKSGNKEVIDYLTSLKGGNVTKKAVSEKGSQVAEKLPKAIPLTTNVSSAAAPTEEKKIKRQREKEEPRLPYKLLFTDENGHVSELTTADFENFKNDYPDIANMLLNPDTIANTSMETEGKQEKETWEKIAKKLLGILWKFKGGYHFHMPVDPIKWNCPDYFDIVKNPMDFGTIKTRLQSNIYKRPQDFVDDMKQVFQNCLIYNGVESEVGKVGIGLEREFDSLLQSHNFYSYINGTAHNNHNVNQNHSQSSNQFFPLQQMQSATSQSSFQIMPHLSPQASELDQPPID